MSFLLAARTEVTRMFPTIQPGERLDDSSTARSTGRKGCNWGLDSGVCSRVYDFLMPHALEKLGSTIQIGEAAQQAKLSIDTIRFYERRALLPRAPRTEGHFRLYTADDVVRLIFIRQMQGLGFSLHEIKQLLDLRDRGGHACGEVKNLLSSKLGEIRCKIHDLQNLERELVLDLHKCDRELRKGRGHGPQHCPILSNKNGRK